MFSNKKWFVLTALVVVASLVLSACQCGEPEEAKEPKTFVVCQGQEPDTLYIYGGAMLAASHIQSALYDSSAEGIAMDDTSFAYQPTITTKLPSLDDGDAVINTTTATAGDTVIDNTGEPVELAAGVLIRPAGCRSSDCAVEYTGGEVEMDQMEVTFTLLDGITWADGTALKASDSVYSFELASHPDTPNPSRYSEERTASYEAPDDKTIVWTGLPGLLDSTYFTNLWIPLPEHAWGEMSETEIVESEEASRLPMGYGAFT
jgi:peptide/nickel transport system substrate-binding protein